jgi:hypothetical protein
METERRILKNIFFSVLVHGEEDDAGDLPAEAGLQHPPALCWRQ